MKRAHFLFVTMIAALLLADTTLVSQSDSSPQETHSQGGEKSAADDLSSVQKETKNRGEDGQSSPAQPESRKHSAGVRHTPAKHPGVSYSKPVRNRQTDQAKTAATSSPFLNTPASIAALQHTASGTVSAPPVKAVTRASAIPSRASDAVNGQQFRNFREPGAHLAVSGGPLTSPGGTAAINGTNMKRKP